MDEYGKLKAKLNEHFLPKRNKHHARYKFLNMKPNAGETTLSYAARLREKAKECEFGDTLNERLLEHLIQTVDNRTLIQKAISKRWDLDQFLSEASQLEDTKVMMKEMREETSEVAKVSRYHRKPAKQTQESRNPNKGKQCDKCGGEQHARPEDCPARGRNCMNCRKRGHYAIVCRSKPHTRQPRRKENQKKHVRKTAADESDNSTSSDDEFFEHLKQAKNIKSMTEHNKTITLRLDDVDVRIEPDSGADVNIMDEHQFKAFVHRSKETKQLTKSKVKLSTLQNKLPVKGEFKVTVRNKTRGVPATFIVVKGRINSAPLISRSTLTELGMLRIDPEGTLATENNLKIPGKPEAQAKTVTAAQNQQSKLSIDKIVSKYSKTV